MALRHFIRPHGAKAARLVLNQETPEHYRVRVPLLHRPIVQKENGRLTSGRPRSVTSSGDHLHSSVAQKQSPRPISERPRRDTGRSHHFRVIGVTASMAVFQTAGAGAAPAWRTSFSSRGVRVLHSALRRRRFEVRVLAGAPFQLPLRRLCGVRSAHFVGRSAPSIPPWQRSAMHRTRNADHAGAAPAGGSFFNPGEEHRSLVSLISWRELVRFQPPEPFRVAL